MLEAEEELEVEEEELELEIDVADSRFDYEMVKQEPHLELSNIKAEMPSQEVLRPENCESHLESAIRMEISSSTSPQGVVKYEKPESHCWGSNVKTEALSLTSSHWESGIKTEVETLTSQESVKFEESGSHCLVDGRRRSLHQMQAAQGDQCNCGTSTTVAKTEVKQERCHGGRSMKRKGQGLVGKEKKRKKQEKTQVKVDVLDKYNYHKGCPKTACQHKTKSCQAGNLSERDVMYFFQYIQSNTKHHEQQIKLMQPFVSLISKRSSKSLSTTGVASLREHANQSQNTAKVVSLAGCSKSRDTTGDTPGETSSGCFSFRYSVRKADGTLVPVCYESFQSVTCFSQEKIGEMCDYVRNLIASLKEEKKASLKEEKKKRGRKQDPEVTQSIFSWIDRYTNRDPNAPCAVPIHISISDMFCEWRRHRVRRNETAVTSATFKDRFLSKFKITTKEYTALKRALTPYDAYDALKDIAPDAYNESQLLDNCGLLGYGRIEKLHFI